MSILSFLRNCVSIKGGGRGGGCYFGNPLLVMLIVMDKGEFAVNNYLNVDNRKIKKENRHHRTNMTIEDLAIFCILLFMLFSMKDMKSSKVGPLSKKNFFL